MDRVVIVSNDLVPEMGTPVAAPGIRAHGLAVGLRSHGLAVEVVVAADAVERYTDVWHGPVPSGHVEVIEGPDLMDRLEESGPAAVIITNGNQTPHLRRSDRLRFVFDLFAPRLLEASFRDEGMRPAGAIERLTSEKLAGMSLADIVITNGRRKLGYALAWMLQAGVDVQTTPLMSVPLCLPVGGGGPGDAPRLMVGGYLQRWSRPGPWLEEVAAAAGGAVFEVVVGSHWGAGRPIDPGPDLDAFVRETGATVHTPVPFAEFRALLDGASAFIDLFEDTPERRMAMVTRSVVALAGGVPVIHPPTTEVGEMIAGSGAGWAVDVDDGPAIRDAVGAAIDTAEVRRRSAAALALSERVFEPGVATAALADSIRES